MAANTEKLWERFSELARIQGLEVFDIETPPGFVRVFITRAQSGAVKLNRKELTVDVSDCARLSREILDLPEIEELMPGDTQLEVSSPGINRKLSRSEHFNNAVGERLRLLVRKDDEPPRDKEVLRGMLLSFDGKQLEIEEDDKKRRQVIDYSRVAEARVDFKF